MRCAQKALLLLRSLLSFFRCLKELCTWLQFIVLMGRYHSNRKTQNPHPWLLNCLHFQKWPWVPVGSLPSRLTLLSRVWVEEGKVIFLHFTIMRKADGKENIAFASKQDSYSPWWRGIIYTVSNRKEQKECSVGLDSFQNSDSKRSHRRVAKGNESPYSWMIARMSIDCLLLRQGNLLSFVLLVIVVIVAATIGHPLLSLILYMVISCPSHGHHHQSEKHEVAAFSLLETFLPVHKYEHTVRLLLRLATCW